MSSNTALSAINPHTYGLKAAAACDPIIDQLFISTDPADLIQSIDFINEQIPHQDDQDLAMRALLEFAATGDRVTAAQIIKSHEYLMAHLHLGKHMHALAMMDEMNLSIDFPMPEIPEMPAYPVRGIDYAPACVSMVEVLRETSMPTHAPDAAIPAATCSII